MSLFESPNNLVSTVSVSTVDDSKSTAKVSLTSILEKAKI